MNKLDATRTLRMSTRQNKALESAAHELGISVADIIRGILFGNKGQRDMLLSNLDEANRETKEPTR